MNDLETVEKALKNATATLPSFVVGTRAEIDIDSAGEEAVWVWVILKDERELSAEDMSRISDKVRQALKGRGITLWPYIRFRTKKEQAEIDQGT